MKYYIINENYEKIAVFYNANLAYHFAHWYARKNNVDLYIVTKGLVHNIILEIHC